MCPPDHKHGATVTCYRRHKCRCPECVTAKQERERPPLTVLTEVCARCPQAVRAGKGRPRLCRDCRYVLSMEELELWAV